MKNLKERVLERMIKGGFNPDEAREMIENYFDIASQQTNSERAIINIMHAYLMQDIP